MRLEQTPRPEQVVRPNIRLITSSTILQFSSDELEHAVSQEQMENPALQVTEHRICLFCGMPIQGEVCNNCGHFSAPTTTTSEFSAHDEHTTEAPIDFASQYLDMGFAGQSYFEDDEDEFDPMARIPMAESLSETLLHQLESMISPEDAAIAEQLVGNLNQRGYLEISTEEVATLLQVPLERVEFVLSQLQMLEPLGIGARTLRECLLIQLQVISELETPPMLTETLITHYLDLLSKNRFQEIARELKVPETEVKLAYHFIRSTLHPSPAYIYENELSYTQSNGDATYIRPDILIRKGEQGFEIELIEEKRYDFKVNRTHTYQQTAANNPAEGDELQRYLRSHSERAEIFVEGMQKRRQTLKRVATLVVDFQQEFLAKGVRFMKPLTRSEIATRLHLDEGTVSRATANKYAMLPNGRLIPIADFFDSSLGIKDFLRELIQAENAKRPYSDEELARILSSRDIPIARRTVTKYREELGIGSSRER